MKYIIPENKLDKIIFKYLDLNLKGLEKKKAKHYEGIIFAYPDEKHGILAYRSDGTLYVYHGLIDEISSVFGVNNYNSKSIIGRWFINRYQLEVINTRILGSGKRYLANDRLD